MARGHRHLASDRQLFGVDLSGPEIRVRRGHVEWFLMPAGEQLRPPGACGLICVEEHQTVPRDAHHQRVLHERTEEGAVQLQIAECSANIERRAPRLLCF